MAETPKEAKKETTKAESPINYHALPDGNPFPEDVAVIETHPGFGVGSKEKYQVYIPIPYIKGSNYTKEDAFCKEHYGCDFKTYLEACNASTRPQYKLIFNEDGTLPANGHRQLQELANNYQIGRTSSGVPQRQKIALGSKYSALMEKTGMSEEEIEKMILDKINKK